MAETKKIIHINTPDLANLDNNQIGINSNVDADLGFRMWGGKDGSGGVTRWLAKDHDARVTDLRITSITGFSGIVQHDSNGNLSGEASLTQLEDVLVASPTDGQLLRYVTANSRWENSTVSLTPTLDDCYNNDSGERSITIDDGNVVWYLDATAAQFAMSLTSNADDTAGFYVNFNGGEYFAVNILNQESQIIPQVISDDMHYDLGANSFNVIATGTVNIAANGVATLKSTNSTAFFGSEGTTSDMYLIGRNTAVQFNDASNLSLSGFTATSIIGALNETLTAIDLDDCYNNDSGERSITVDDGNVVWYLDASTSQFKIDLTTNTTTNAGFYVTYESRYFRLRNVYIGGGVYRLQAESDAVTYNLTADSFMLASSGAVNMTSSGDSFTAGSTDSSSDLILYGRNNSIALNDASNLTLSGFTATTIIGALNELRALH